jgi:hypothetical protein
MPDDNRRFHPGRALMGAAAITLAMAVTLSLSGGDEAPEPMAAIRVAPLSAPPNRPAPAATELSPVPSIAKPEESPGDEEQLVTEAAIERWTQRPPLRPSAFDVERDVQIACIEALTRIRPVVGGTDAENLASIRGRRSLERTARRMQGLPPEPPPEPEPKIKCPEHMLMELFERSRNDSDR